ncbi:hypothetical protein SAMD00023353_6200270 [Rosellinia necatrix]|uniref:Uncharacterized protein n=1 Tax=Rosellinia necatrix TaxID=77044 RepID=A0A1W2TSG8_ROSNE|nr:hypothetical protein SAMD00023353_6200270 [Rosellinia necatrix]
MKARGTGNQGINNSNAEQQNHRDREESRPDGRAYELRLWPRPRLQAYCLEHFLAECEIYHNQENSRYNKLIAHSRAVFLETQNKKGSSANKLAPTRRQPSRRAKEKHSVLEKPPGPVEHSHAPFKPARLEKAFAKSPEGAMFRNLAKFRESLGLHGSWEDYRAPLESKIVEAAGRLQAAQKENGRGAHENCAFSGPLGIKCRYCGFVDTAPDDEDYDDDDDGDDDDDDGVVGPPKRRRLAEPAPMRAVELAASDASEARLVFRGTDFVVDACGEETMVVLVGFKGVLDLCAELFEEEKEGEAILYSPTSLSARLRDAESKQDDGSGLGVKRQTEELEPDGRRKKQD